MEAQPQIIYHQSMSSQYWSIQQLNAAQVQLCQWIQKFQPNQQIPNNPNHNYNQKYFSPVSLVQPDKNNHNNPQQSSAEDSTNTTDYSRTAEVESCTSTAHRPSLAGMSMSVLTGSKSLVAHSISHFVKPLFINFHSSQLTFTKFSGFR